MSIKKFSTITLVIAHETASQREEISERGYWLLFLILQRSKFNPDCIEGTCTKGNSLVVRLAIYMYLDDIEISIPSILGISRYVDDRGFK